MRQTEFDRKRNIGGRYSHRKIKYKNQIEKLNEKEKCVGLFIDSAQESLTKRKKYEIKSK